MPNSGNRQDNRQRGNAAQLLEKYKSLARDAQLAGDRVQTEYYFQFADHYHRVLNENRSRYEDNRRQQGDFGDEEEDQEENVSAESYGNGRDDRREERFERQPREQREQREPRPEREFVAREPREEQEEQRAEGEYRNGSGEQRPRRQRLPRRERPQPEAVADNDIEERIALDVLPPAIGVTEEEPAVAAPRRRTRRPRASDGGEEIAPAA